MSERSKGISLPQLSILLSPAPTDAVFDLSVTPAAERANATSKAPTMNAKAKVLQFGLADPNKVTDLSVDNTDKALAEARQSDSERRAGYRHVERVRMPLQRWAGICSNKTQRDTEKRAKGARHLHAFDPVHPFVNVGRLPDGTMFKADGHTRCYLWTTGKVVGPSYVEADIYECDTEDAVVALYDRFDGSVATKTSSDKVSGAMRLHDISPKSSFVRAARFGTALKLLYRKQPDIQQPNRWTEDTFVRDAVGHYKEQIEFLDTLGPSASLFPVGVTMAVITSHKLHGLRVKRFWEDYSKCRGTRDGEHMDPVQALHEEVLATRDRSRKEDSGYSLQGFLFGKSVLAVERYLQGGLFKTGRHGGIRGEDEELSQSYLLSQKPSLIHGK